MACQIRVDKCRADGSCREDWPEPHKRVAPG